MVTHRYIYGKEDHYLPQSIAEVYFHIAENEYPMRAVLGDFLDFFYLNWNNKERGACIQSLTEPISINDKHIKEACILAAIADQLNDDFKLGIDTPWFAEPKFILETPFYGDMSMQPREEIKAILEEDALERLRYHNVFQHISLLNRQGFYPMADKYGFPRLVSKKTRKNKVSWLDIE